MGGTFDMLCDVEAAKPSRSIDADMEQMEVSSSDRKVVEAFGGR